MALQTVVFFVGAISQYGRSRAMYPNANVEDSSIDESVGGDTVANATGSIYGLVFKGTFQAAELPWADSFADFVGYLIPASAGKLLTRTVHAVTWQTVIYTFYPTLLSPALAAISTLVHTHDPYTVFTWPF